MAGSSERVYNLRLQQNCRNFFYHLRGITFVSDILIHGAGYIQNFTVKVQNALVKKAVVITAGHVNGVLLVCVASTLLWNFINKKEKA